MLLYRIYISTLFHDIDGRLTTGRGPSYDGVQLNNGKINYVCYIAGGC